MAFRSHQENKGVYTKWIFNGSLSYSWLLGRRPEFTDPKVVAQGEGREGRNYFEHYNLFRL